MRTLYDIPFHSEKPETLLDIYLPDSPAPAAGYSSVLVIHGGGWKVGNKSDLRQVQMSTLLAEHGFVAFNMNYTLAPQDAERDDYTKQAFKQCKQALAWIRQNGETYQLNLEKIGAIGGSAGGNMALMLGFTAENPKYAYGLGDLGKISAIVSLYAPVTRPKDLHVINHLHAHVPPVLSLHGTADALVPLEETLTLDREMSTLGARHEYVVVDGAPHTFNIISKWGDFSERILSFFDQYLQA